MNIIPVLTGEKVTLARLRREDIGRLTELFSNLELTTYLTASGQTFSEGDEENYFERVNKNVPNNVTFGIYEKETERLIGGVDLRDINHRHETAELGVSIHDPAYWGGGYGSESVQLIVEYGFYFLGLHNIFLRVFGFNERAIAAYRKVGFCEIGRRRGGIRLGGERYDIVYMDITADDVDWSRMRALAGFR